MPNVVVTTVSGNDSDDTNGSTGTKAVLYQDLIAILTVAVQDQQEVIEQLAHSLNETEESDRIKGHIISGLEARIQKLEEFMSRQHALGNMQNSTG